MKFKIFRTVYRKFNEYFKRDLFNRTRYRLTFFYSGLLMLFLILFMIISYSIFYALDSKEQRQETNELASQVMLSNQIQFQNILKHNIKENNNIVISSTNQEAFFCYLFDTAGNFMAGIDKNSLMHIKILKEIDGWSPKENELRHMLIQNSNGQSFYIQVTGVPVYDNDKIVGMLFLGRDLTFFYNTLKRLLFILIVLSLIFLIFASFIGYYMAKRAMVPIIDAYEKQQAFVADASHELRTPLSVLQSSIEVIEMEEKNNVSEFSYSIIHDMKDEVRGMKKLVSDLLSLARYDSKEYSLNYELFEFNTIADQILRTAEILGESKKIKITLDTTKPLMVYGDKEKLKQLLYILIDNAIKYSSDSGKIIISLNNRTIENIDQFIIKVKDSGVGISPELYDRIFDRFYRIDKIRSREEGGTGLGLAIAKSIVEEHGGNIKVQSNPGEGTEFTVKIPNERK